MSHLLPCPFCGENNPEIEHMEGTILHPAYVVKCGHCGAQAPWCDKGNHEANWNQRAKLRTPVADERAVHPEIQAVLAMLDVPVLGYLGSHSVKLTTSADRVDSFESAIPLVSETAHRAACEKIISALASAPVAGEADQDEMERLGWVNIGYKYDLEKARRAISFCNIPGFDTMSLDNAIYWLRAKADDAAPQASESTEDAFDDGWREAAIWSGRDDLLADMDSFAYKAARARCVGKLDQLDAPQASEAQCSCPSGDGSLRHPCAVHGTGLLNRDEQRLAVWQAIQAITIGNLHDDKLIVANLNAAGYVISRAALSAQPGAQSKENDS